MDARAPTGRRLDRPAAACWPAAMRRALLVPLLLAATALPAEAAFQERDPCRRTIALDDGTTLRLAFNVFPSATPASRRLYQSIFLWADGRALPDLPRNSSHYLMIDLEVSRTLEGESAELDHDVLLDALRANATLETGFGAFPIRDGARIAREADQCMTRSGREPPCSHIVRLEDGRSIRFEFRHGGPAYRPRGDALELAVSVRGSALPLAGTRRAKIQFSQTVRERSPFTTADLASFVRALHASPDFELRNSLGHRLRTISIPDVDGVTRQAEHCIALREAGGR